jgi:hypothetical protein
MFIAWIPQMIALLDKREARAVHAILFDIAQQYAPLLPSFPPSSISQ